MSIWHFDCGHYGDTDNMENYDEDGELCDDCWQKREEEKEEEDSKEYTCGSCNGSGEGYTDGSKCPICHGHGSFINKPNEEDGDAEI